MWVKWNYVEVATERMAVYAYIFLVPRPPTPKMSKTSKTEKLTKMQKKKKGPKCWIFKVRVLS